MSRITIPDEALEAGARALAAPYDWERGDSMWRIVVRENARAAFLAIVEAWPGKDIVGYGPPLYGIDLILPLPQENSDE